VGLVWYVGKRDRKRRMRMRRRRRKIINFWEMENFHLKCGGEEWKNKYVLCV
jgi:hypothetical protein